MSLYGIPSYIELVIATVMASAEASLEPPLTGEDQTALQRANAYFDSEWTPRAGTSRPVKIDKVPTPQSNTDRGKISTPERKVRTVIAKRLRVPTPTPTLWCSW